MSVQLEAGAGVQMMSTELNALADGSGVLQVVGTNPAYDNSAVGNLYMWADFELTVTFTVAPNADSSVELYMVPALDGTNFSDTANGATPIVDKNRYLGSFNISAQTTLQRRTLAGVPLSPVLFKLFAIDKSGQAFPPTGSLLKMTPYREK